MISPKPLVDGVLLGTNPDALYTVPAGKAAIIQACIIVATGGTPTVQLYLGSGSGPANQLLRNKALSTDQVYIVTELQRHVLSAGQSIYGSADVGGAVAMRVSGVEVDV